MQVSSVMAKIWGLETRKPNLQVYPPCLCWVRLQGATLTSQTCRLLPLNRSALPPGLDKPSLLHLTGEAILCQERGETSSERRLTRCHLWRSEKAIATLSMTHAQKLLWTQIREVEPSARWNSLHLLTRVLSPPTPDSFAFVSGSETPGIQHDL